MAELTKIFEFDAAHRIMNERVKCFNLHGHRFKVEIVFGITGTTDLGYVLDFKEVNRVAGGWIDRFLDHGTILNPRDAKLSDLCQSEGWKLYTMGLGKDGDINPSAENLASEILYVMRLLFQNRKGVEVKEVVLYETPTCYVKFDEPLYKGSEVLDFTIRDIAEHFGEVSYDVRDYAKA